MPKKQDKSMNTGIIDRIWDIPGGSPILIPKGYQRAYGDIHSFITALTNIWLRQYCTNGEFTDKKINDLLLLWHLSMYNIKAPNGEPYRCTNLCAYVLLNSTLNHLVKIVRERKKQNTLTPLQAALYMTDIAQIQSVYVSRNSTPFKFRIKEIS